MTEQVAPPSEQVSAADLAKQAQGLKGALNVSDADFDQKVTEYLTIVEMQKTQQRAESAGAINQAKDQLAGVIGAAVKSLGLEKLYGETITRVSYTFVPAQVASGDVPAQPATTLVLVNPAGRAPSVRRASNGGNGDRRDLIADFHAVATTEQKRKLAELEAKYADEPKVKNSRTWQYKDKVVGDYGKAHPPSSHS